MGILLLIPILFPILAGIPVFWIHNSKTRRIYVSVIVVVNALMVYGFAFLPDTSLSVWTITENLAIKFQMDGISRFFSCLIASVWALVTFYAYEYIQHEGAEERYLAVYTMTFGIMMGLSYTANMMTLYMFYELMTFITVPLVIHSRTREAIMAGLKYLGFSVFGAGLALIGFFFLHSFCGPDITFAAGGILDPAKVAGNEGAVLAAYFVMMIGFGCKAGMLPLQAWLPTAHPVAPAPASAVLSGLITKGGVLAIIRITYYMVGVDLLRGTWVQYTLMILAMCTVFIGSMLAYKEKLLKKRLAYSSVSQVSYVLFGLFLMTPTGFLGALLQIVFHAVAKNILFLSAGSIIYMTHKTRVDELRGIGKQMPIVMWCFTFASLSLIGIPPASGFFSKWFLATGAITPEFGALGYVGAATLMVSALLTAGYLLPVIKDAFFPGKDFDYPKLKKKEPSVLMTVPLIILSTAVIGLGMFPNGLVLAIENICGALM